MNTSTECDIDPTGEICRCGGRMMQRTCPTCDEQKEYCEICGETEMEQQHAQEVEALTKTIEDLRAENRHDTDMLGTLLFEAEKDARYQYGCVEARNAYAWGNRHQPWLAHMCPWCQLENGQHTNECPEQQWPARRPRRRERTGRPLRLLLTIPNIPVGVKTCRCDGWRCPFLASIADDDVHICDIAQKVGWTGQTDALAVDTNSQPIRCDGCLNSEE